MLSYFFQNDKRLEAFFSSLDMKKKYLLALSGGSDSLFLFYLLKRIGLSFSSAHVNYGWRPSSNEEAEYLQSLCKKENIPFFVNHVPPIEQTTKDMENEARRYRYEWFYNLCMKNQLSGIFLAHHANDQAETVLKRLLEGAHFGNLKGMANITDYQGVPLFRPLLHIPKKTILEIVNTLRLNYVQDVTNNDERFLRARMRKKLFPWLEEVFGKNIIPPLLTLSEDSKELAQYLAQQATPYLEKSVNQDGMVALFMPVELMDQMFLAKWVCKEFFNRSGLIVSRHIIQTVYDHLLNNSSVILRVRNREIKIQDRTIKIMKK